MHFTSEIDIQVPVLATARCFFLLFLNKLFNRWQGRVGRGRGTIKNEISDRYNVFLRQKRQSTVKGTALDLGRKIDAPPTPTGIFWITCIL
jgi:hypothetical protein